MCASGVLDTFEQHEECIATELEDVATVGVDDLDHPTETAVQQAGELLRALAPVFRESFRQRREARDVRRHERSAHTPVWGIVGVPTPDEVANIRLGRGRWRGVHRLTFSHSACRERCEVGCQRLQLGVRQRASLRRERLIGEVQLVRALAQTVGLDVVRV